MTKKNFTIQKMAAVGLLSALVFIFSGVRIQFGEVAAVHLGNGFCALAGLLFGPGVGGLASGIGSMLYDFTNPAYIAESWITFLTKFAIGFVAGLIARRGLPSLRKDVLAAAAGSFTYVALYLLKSFIIKFWVEGQAWGAVATQLAAKGVTSCINAVAAIVVATLLAQAIRPALRRAHLLQV